MKTNLLFNQLAKGQTIPLSSAMCANTPPYKKHTPSHKSLTLSIALLFAFLTVGIGNAWAIDYTWTGSVTSSGNTAGTKTILRSDTPIPEGATITQVVVTYTFSYGGSKERKPGSISVKVGTESIGSSTNITTSGTFTTSTTTTNSDNIVVTFTAGTSKQGKNTYNNTLTVTQIVVTYTLPLATPTGLNVTNITSTSATLSWGEVANASSYSVQILGDDNFDKTISDITSTSTTVNGLTPETDYVFGVTAIGDGTNYTNSGESITGEFSTVAASSGGDGECSNIDVTDGSTVILPNGSTGYAANNWKDAGAPTAYSDEATKAIGTNKYCVTFTNAADYNSEDGLQLKASVGVLKIENITSTSGVDITIVCSGTNGLKVELTGATTLTEQSGEVTISTSSTNATLTISKNTNNAGYIKTITIAPKSGGVTPDPGGEVVNWSIKGSTTTTTLSNGTTTIPTLTEEQKECGGKIFVGWTATKNYENATTAPTDLFTTTLPNGLTNGTTFYAVYADSRETTTITYTWDLVKQSPTPALATGDQIVITAKSANYALSTTQNRNDRDAVEITKHSTGDSITINEDVQIITLQKWDASDERFALSVGTSQYLSGANEKFTTSTRNSNNTNWYMGFNSENSPYIYTQVEEGKRNNKTVNEYYIQYSSFFGIYHSFDVSKNRDPENISIYRKTKHENTTTINSSYTTDCGCTAPANALAFPNNLTTPANTALTLMPTYTGNGGTITYTCSDAAHTTITNGNQFTATALGSYTITATQGVNDNECGAVVDFEVEVTCATPSITPTTYEATINTPVDLASIITSTSTMPLTFTCTNENVYISGTTYTFLAADTYTITASQAAGGIYCAGSQNITITVTDPCASKTKPSVNASNITTDGFQLSWSSLSNVSTYRIYNNTTGDSDETTSTSYTFSGLNPSTEYSWTVEAVYSDDCTAATSGTTTTTTPAVTYTVNWNVAGSGYGSSTTVNHGEKVSVLPSAPDPTEYSCTGKVFVGWTKSQFVDGTRPADLFTTAEGSPAITAATTFYAVFADCVTGGGDDTPEDDTQGEWTLVTDMSVLEVGTKIFIAAAEENLSLSTTQNSNNRGTASITKSGNTATIDASTQVLTLATGTTSGTWAFNTGSGYLYAASSSSNYLRTKAELDDNGSWSISVTNAGIATIKAQGDNSRNWLRKNSSSSLFSCYSSGQDDVVIYYKSGESTPVEPTEYTVTLSVLGTETTTTTEGNYTLPSTVSGTCDGKTFVGWTTTENLSSSTEPTSNYWAKGTAVTISGDVTFYAVFATESAGGGGEGDTYSLVTSANDFTDGTYAIAALSSNTYYFVNGECDSDGIGVETTGLAQDNSFSSALLPTNAVELEIEDDGEPDGENHYYFISYYDETISNWKFLDDNGTNKTLKWVEWSDELAVYTYHPVFDSKTYLLSGSGAAVSQNGSTKASFIRNYENATVYNSLYFFKKSGGTTYSDYSTECDASTCTSPTITFNNGTYTIGSTALDLSTLFTSNSSGAVTYTVSNANSTGASINGTNFTATSVGIATVKASQAANGNYCEKEVTATITVTAASATTYTVTWMVNGSETHSQTGTAGTAITMPTDPADNAIGNCANKFMGWSASNLGATTGQDAPSDLFTTSPGNISKTVTYYAVFATATTSGGGEASATLSFASTAQRTTYNTSQQVWEQNGITLTNNKASSTSNVGDYSNPARFYAKSSVTIEYTKNITKIDVICSSNEYASELVESVGSEASASSTTVTITPTTSSTTYTISSLSGQVRMNSLTVYYATSGGSSTTTYSDYVTSCSTGDEGGDEPDPEPTGTSYVKVTSALSDYSGEYLIVYEDGNVAFNGGLTTLDAVSNTISVTITNNTIAATDATNAAKFTIAKIDDGYSIKSASGYYIGRTSNSNGFNESNSTVYSNTITYNNGITITSSANPTLKYNAANDQNRFRYYASGQQSISLYKLTTTSASAPAKRMAGKTAKKAMKKAATVKAEKSEMGVRPIVKAPAALAEQTCTSYENYTTICCANPITDFKYAAGANSITLYWTTAATSATATLYSDEECISQVTDASQSGITTGTCTFTGLAKTTTYYAKVTTDDGCTAVLEVSTERPIVSVAEWAATQINIDINTHEPIKVYLENEVTGGSTSGDQAEELFFSKYYEATGNVKLVAVYNGTPGAINLANYTIKYGKTSWEASYIALKDFGATKGSIQPGEEIILYTMYTGDNRDVEIMNCVNSSYPDGTWVEVTNTNNTGGGKLSFGGDKTIALFNGTTMIDVIGAVNDEGKPTNANVSSPSWGDAKGWTCADGLSIDDGTMIGLSTNRCLLVRNNTVTSGENAVESNTTTFTTLCTEWKGAHVPDDDADDGVGASCENFAFVGTFDYSDYYVKYEELATSDELPADGRLEDGTYMVTTPDLHDIACTNMRISVKTADGKTTLVTQDYKVPIIVDADISTNNQIYFQYTQRENVSTAPELPEGQNENILTPDICADCDVVIRDSKTLTHVTGGVSQFNNMMVYPNAKMHNVDKQPFNLNTLQMQGQNDAVSYAIIENDGSSIDVGDMVFVKRIDDKYWYNFSLPYDCKVADIIQQNGQSMGKYWVDWGIKEYDGKTRQTNGDNNSAGEVGKYWVKVEETATLKAHQGYIIGLFTTEWTNQMKFVYFTPASTNPYREAGTDAKTTNIDSWYTSNLLTVAARHRGWNFTGSPYISMFNPQAEGIEGVGLNNADVLMTRFYDSPENDDYNEYEALENKVYISVPTPKGGLYYDQYVASSTSILPFTAYFVQAVDPTNEEDNILNLTYAKGGRELTESSSAPARTPAATKQRVLAELLVTAPDGQTDNTGVWVDERYKPEYEIAADLSKLYVAGAKPQLYTLASNGEMMAYHALPDANAMNIPLRLYAPKAGDYTLTLNQRVSRLAGAESIELLYNNAVVANMLIQDYTLTAAARGTVNGYSLSIVRKADVSTAIDNVTGSTITVVANDGHISITGIPADAKVGVFDMLGRLLATQNADGQTVVNIPAVPQGVYNIVVGNSNGHTTIKTVVK